MTRSPSDSPDGAAGWPVPELLPSFASFAAIGPGDPDGHPFVAEEAALLSERAVAGRRKTFRLGRAAAHAALQVMGRDEVAILTGPGREPIWPAGIAGAISHVSELGVALVAPAADTDGVGIDIEETGGPRPELEGQVPRSEELAWLDRAEAADRDRLLLALFSAKESLFKAFYPRIGSLFGFEAAALAPAPAGFTARMVADLDPDYPADRTFHVACSWTEQAVLTWLILPKTPA
ncbi:MAG: 4'-phosphopantetheinyl transferase family protein [Acidimicrobiia bacterium]